MKLLIDFFPIVLFFAAFKIWDIYVATGVAIVATLAQIAWLRYSTGKVETMQWLSLGIIVVFGGATILAHDETFIKWKPTVLYWLMGRNYTSAVMAGGYCGFMLGTTANAMACMNEITRKTGPAPQAFFAVGIVGAFLIDFINALLITQALNLFG